MASSEQLRERILDAAVSVLAEVGRPTSKVLSAVAERAGVSRPTIYRHVGTQGEMFQALVRRELERRVKSDILPALNGLQNPYEDLARALEVQIGMISDHPVIKYVVHEHPATVVRMLDELGPMVLEVCVPALQPVFDEAVAAGRFPAIDVPALVVWSSRLAGSRITLPTETPLREEIDQLFRIASAIGAVKP
jgi:AcrR family transcriptional regulator